MAKKKTNLKEVTLPPGCNAAMKKEFNRIKPLLEEAGLCALDQAALINYLTHYSIFLQAKTMVEKTGIMELSASGQTRINPALSIMKSHSESTRKYIGELGLSPSARKKLKVDLNFSGEDVEDNSDDFGG